MSVPELRHPTHRLARHVCAILRQHLPDDLLDHPPVDSGHCVIEGLIERAGVTCAD
jgi:hypothetical protein